MTWHEVLCVACKFNRHRECPVIWKAKVFDKKQGKPVDMNQECICGCKEDI